MPAAALPAAAQLVNLTLESGWVRAHHPPPHRCGANRRSRCNERCFDQRLATPELCSKPICCGCAYCQHATGRWTSPSGVELETLTSATDPPFVWAYNPLDQDMLYARHRRLVEPGLSSLWVNVTAPCCQSGGRIVDVGANFGWYSLLSLSLGCRVDAFEPVSSYRDVIRLAVHLNPGFAARLRLFANVAFDQPGKYAVVVPRAGERRPAAPAGAPLSLSTHMRTMLGMAAMLGPDGLAAVKDVTKLGAPQTSTYREMARAVRVDEVVSAGDDDGGSAAGVCMIKVDVEGLEPQALRSAYGLLAARSVAAVQLELTRKDRQACANRRLLRDLWLLGLKAG